MPFLHELGPDDIFINRLETAPLYEFVGYSGSLYVNNAREESGKNVPTGSISLFELNVDRATTLDDTNSIHSFVVKNGDMWSFKSITTGSYNEEQYGTKLTGSYPLTSSISRNYIYGGRVMPYHSHELVVINGKRVISPDDPGFQSTDTYFSQSRPLMALQNSIEKYRILSPVFTYSGSKGIDPTIPPYMTGAINLIAIPAIFYGSSIEKGSVDLKFYYTGTLMDQAKDEKRNGELISTQPGSEVSGSVVGVVLYDEGFVLLYNEKNINGNAVVVDSYTGTGSSGAGTGFRPNWTYFMSHDTGSSGSQGIATGSGDHSPGGAVRTDANYGYFPSASHFSLSFRGKNIVPTMTMFANAPPGTLNNSQNPTWISSSHSSWRNQIHFDSSSYIEPELVSIKNTVKSEYSNHEEGFEKQTFISKIGIYDKDKNLLGIAKIATPVLKRETDSYTFKLKLDL